MGRRKLKIDPDRVFKLGRLGCTEAEIADIVGCSTDTLQRRFAAEIARARACRKMSLRRAQTIRAVRDRSDAMLIHLGKVELGQGGAGDGSKLGAILDEILDGGEHPPGAGDLPR